MIILFVWIHEFCQNLEFKDQLIYENLMIGSHMHCLKHKGKVSLFSIAVMSSILSHSQKIQPNFVRINVILVRWFFLQYFEQVPSAKRSAEDLFISGFFFTLLAKHNLYPKAPLSHQMQK